MNVAQVIDRLHEDEAFRAAQPGRSMPFPDSVAPALTEGLQKRGIPNLYTHQYEAVMAFESGKNVCVVTPTASGKTLCCNLPVLNRLLRDPESLALLYHSLRPRAHVQNQLFPGRNPP